LVGDSREDLAMATENGLSFAAAAWGYGDAVSGIPHGGVARAGDLRKPAEGPIHVVLESIDDLLLLVLPEAGAGRRP
jgi:phosphoglycolate phosphatase-like HAD superfamily hydrolase